MFICYCGQKFNKINYYNLHKQQCNALSPKDQIEYFKKFCKTSFDNIEFINNVPKVVFICWFGVQGDEIPYMSLTRFNAFQNLIKNIDVPIILISELNYKWFIKKNHTLHESFQYLSGVHKSDYFRCYLLLHYGGGYHDIKFREESWKNCWNDDDWLENENIWMFGRREKYEGAIGYPPGMKYIQKEYNKLITMCWIICKPNTLFLIDLVKQIENKLDYHMNNLIKYPAKLPKGYYYNKPFDLVPEESYPIRWLEILGELFHPLMLKYNEHIKFGLPDALKKRYK